jgi:hypothetical protein
MLKRKGDQAYPLLRVDNEECDDDGNIKSMHLSLNSPIPSKPVMADFLDGAKVFVSKRIAKVMQEMNTEGVQFIPTKLTMPKGEIIEDYICVLVDNNTYKAMDEEKSVYTKDDDDDEDMVFYTVEKVVLDCKVLSKIPLNKRLRFRLKETPGDYLFHETVIKKIQTLNPTGVFFVDIEEYEF